MPNLTKINEVLKFFRRNLTCPRGLMSTTSSDLCSAFKNDNCLLWYCCSPFSSKQIMTRQQGTLPEPQKSEKLFDWHGEFDADSVIVYFLLCEVCSKNRNNNLSLIHILYLPLLATRLTEYQLKNHKPNTIFNAVRVWSDLYDKSIIRDRKARERGLIKKNKTKKGFWNFDSKLLTVYCQFYSNRLGKVVPFSITMINLGKLITTSRRLTCRILFIHRFR